eukprot:TCONS_00050790-protein
MKTFEKIVRKNIVNYLEENNIFNDSQHGFRQGRSCLSQLLEHYDTILSYLERGINVDTIYLDFSKAFDKVDHAILLHKLSQLGIKGKLLRCIESFLKRQKTICCCKWLQIRKCPCHIRSTSRNSTWANFDSSDDF